VPQKEITSLKPFLDKMADKYNQIGFIEHDPICIPHRFTKKQDIEIAGLFASALAWGQRKIIINKCRTLMEIMDSSPHDFILNYTKADLKQAEAFKHRTFNGRDLVYFFELLRHHYQNHSSLEAAFIPKSFSGNIEDALNYFRQYFFSLPHPERTRKHVASPDRKSACKRLNMYLRWMVRKDNAGVDFGLWTKIKPGMLVCPLDVHVNRVARYLGLIERSQTDWQAAVELTSRLKEFDANDPVKYDFALFGLGEEGVI
jgi:uncharacterized protein (TIGR02757 family)